MALDVFVIAVRGDLSQCPAILKQYYFDPEMALQLHTMSSGKDGVTGTSMTVAVRALMTLLPVKLSLLSFLRFVVIESSKRKKTFEGESINQNVIFHSAAHIHAVFLKSGRIFTLASVHSSSVGLLLNGASLLAGVV